MADITQFLHSVCDPAGHHVVAFKDGERVKQKLVQGLFGIEQFCIQNSNILVDCWFAPASFSQGWHTIIGKDGQPKNVLRTQDNASSFKSLWLDIDVGEGKPYKSRNDAYLAIAKLTKTLGLRRPWALASGEHGVHVYYPFTEPVGKDRWLKMALALKTACAVLNIHADPSRTADAASILRAPHTYNTKMLSTTGWAHPVTFLYEGVELPPETYEAALKEYEQPIVEKPVHIVPNLQLDGPVPDNADEIAEKYFPEIDTYPERDCMDVISQCGQVQAQTGAEEPVWRGMLSVLRLTKRGRSACHVMSRLDKRYSYADTEDKINQLEEKDVGPYLCSTFESLRPSTCDKCPHRGRITTPLMVPELPKKDAGEPKSEVQVVEESAGEEQLEQAFDAPQEPDIPELMGESGFYKVNKNGCFKKAIDDGEAKWKLIYPYPVYPVQMVSKKNAKDESCASYIFRHHRQHKVEDIEIEGEVLMGTTLSATLGRNGFLLRKHEKESMGELMIDVLRGSSKNLDEVKATDRLGWNDRKDAFLLGNKLYKSNGNVFEVHLPGKARRYAEASVPHGDLEKWKQIANVYNKPGLEWAQAVMAAAFASPIMSIGALEKAAVLFLTGEKGVGKSTALMMGASIYGNPDVMMFNKFDTPNSRLHKLGIVSNVAAMFDEMTDLSPREASQMVYTITQGRGKDRMAGGGETLLQNTTYWSTLPVMSANDSIINALSLFSADATAQMSRVLEVKATDINNYYTKEEVRANNELVRQLPENYGVAGDMYIRFVVTHMPEIRKYIEQAEKKFLKITKLNSNYRFWTYMATRMLVGLLVAKHLGLVQYDIGRFVTYLAERIRDALGSMGKYTIAGSSIVANFIHDNISNRIVVHSAKRTDGVRGRQIEIEGNGNYVKLHPVPGRDLNVRLELDTGDCYISKEAVKDWCVEKNMPLAEFERALSDNYKVVRMSARTDLGKYTTWRSVTGDRINTYQIQVDPKSLMGDDEDGQEES